MAPATLGPSPAELSYPKKQRMEVGTHTTATAEHNEPSNSLPEKLVEFGHNGSSAS